MPDQLAITFAEPHNPRRHYARVEGSPTLQRLLRVLLDGEWHSTRDLSIRAECYSEGGQRWEYKLIYCPERLREFMEGR